jgi:transposase
MTKYSSELKIEIVSKYLKNEYSLGGLAKEYGIGLSVINSWVDLAKAQGLSALKVKRTKGTYSLQFKLDVVRYYLTNDIGISKTAAKFNVNPSQVYAWVHRFNEQGMAGLLVKKGRPSKMSKKKKHAPKLDLSEKQRYEEKILKQEAEIERLRVENLVLKKVAARYPRYPINEKHK